MSFLDELKLFVANGGAIVKADVAAIQANPTVQAVEAVAAPVVQKTEAAVVAQVEAAAAPLVQEAEKLISDEMEAAFEFLHNRIAELEARVASIIQKYAPHA